MEVLENSGIAGLAVRGRRLSAIRVLEIVLLAAALVLPLFLDHSGSCSPRGP